MTKFFIRFFWIIIIFSFIRFQPVLIPGSEERTIKYLDYSDNVSTGNFSAPIAIMGDLQRTSMWEMMVGREQNDSEREVLLKAIKNESPSMLILLGDMVSSGDEVKNWNYFDSLLLPVNNIPVLPVMGNHDYSGDNEYSGYRFARKRFKPLETSTWYTRKYGNIAFIFLDSNEDQLTNIKWHEQRKWFIQTLKSYDDDNNIKGVIVFTHHPPFTNSIVTGDEENIQNVFVKPFMKSRKTIAFFSGHAHTYERFRINGKDFIVSGGGGGPRVFLKKGSECHKDECTIKGVRPFHYVILQPGENSINIKVKGVNKNDDKFFTVDSVSLSLR